MILEIIPDTQEKKMVTPFPITIGALLTVLKKYENAKIQNLRSMRIELEIAVERNCPQCKAALQKLREHLVGQSWKKDPQRRLAVAAVEDAEAAFVY